VPSYESTERDNEPLPPLPAGLGAPESARPQSRQR
jgi:hypothetical protein